MLSIEKELLIARLNYLDEIHEKPGSDPVDLKVSQKVKDLIEVGEISSFMLLESVYFYLDEKTKEDKTEVDQFAREIISFID